MKDHENACSPPKWRQVHVGDQQNQRGLPKLKPVANIGQGEGFPVISFGNTLTAPIISEKLSNFAQGREVELTDLSWIIGAHDERS